MAVAAASHNELLTGISGALKKATEIEDYGTDETCLGVIKGHRAILDTIGRKDSAAAKKTYGASSGPYELDLAGHVAPQLDISYCKFNKRYAQQIMS
jgi:hypothetical protein